MVGGFQVIRLGTVSSTQDVLRERARAGEDVTGICVRSESQSSGRGRRGTAWASLVGGSYQSVGLGREARPWLTLALGVGIAESLSELAGFHVSVKWPNDLHLAGAKLGGILTEVIAGQVIVGVGVNVGNEVSSGAARLRGLEVEDVSDAVLAGLQRGAFLADAGGQAVSARFAAVDFLAGRRVELEVPGSGKVSGYGRGVDPQGALLVVREATGEVVRVVTGHVLRYGEASGRSSSS